MKNYRIFLFTGILIALSIFAVSCSSSKSSVYPKRLQRSVKCSSIHNNKVDKNNQKVAIIASINEMSHNSMSN